MSSFKNDQYISLVTCHCGTVSHRDPRRDPITEKILKRKGFIEQPNGFETVLFLDCLAFLRLL